MLSITQNVTNLNQEKGIDQFINEPDTARSRSWFSIHHDKIKALVLGQDIPLGNDMDFPLDFILNKPVIIIQHGYLPVVCKVMAIDELTQQVKIELFLEKKKPTICIQAETIYRAYDLICYSGIGSVPQSDQIRIKNALNENNIKFVHA